MICNFSPRNGIESLAKKIKNGVPIELDDIQAINPDFISTPVNAPIALSTKRSLKQTLSKLIKFPWHILKTKIDALIELKLVPLHQEIDALNKRIQTLEINHPPANLSHRNNSWNSSNQNI